MNELNSIIMQIMRHCRNFFIRNQEDGEFTIINGRITLTQAYKVGQYILLLDDINIVTGIYKIIGVDDIFPNDYLLDDEELNAKFEGSVYSLAIPPDFLSLCNDILKFTKKHMPTAYKSETVVNLHNWTMGTKDNGAPITLFDVFSDRFKPFMRMFAEVSI